VVEQMLIGDYGSLTSGEEDDEQVVKESQHDVYLKIEEQLDIHGVSDQEDEFESPDEPHSDSVMSVENAGASSPRKDNQTSAANHSSWRLEYPLNDSQLSPELVGTVKKFTNLRRTGGNINRDLRRQKQFKNPDLLERLIQQNQLLEIGSNFDAETFNPFRWDETAFYDSLAREQAKLLEEEKRQEEKKEREKERDRERDHRGKQKKPSAVSFE
jgi:hypothetical protein